MIVPISLALYRWWMVQNYLLSLIVPSYVQKAKILGYTTLCSQMTPLLAVSFGNIIFGNGALHAFIGRVTSPTFGPMKNVNLIPC